MTGAIIVYLKELKDVLRDRRIVLHGLGRKLRVIDDRGQC